MKKARKALSVLLAFTLAFAAFAVAFTSSAEIITRNGPFTVDLQQGRVYKIVHFHDKRFCGCDQAEVDAFHLALSAAEEVLAQNPDSPNAQQVVADLLANNPERNCKFQCGIPGHYAADAEENGHVCGNYSMLGDAKSKITTVDPEEDQPESFTTYPYGPLDFQNDIFQFRVIVEQDGVECYTNGRFLVKINGATYAGFGDGSLLDPDVELNDENNLPVSGWLGLPLTNGAVKVVEDDGQDFYVSDVFSIYKMTGDITISVEGIVEKTFAASLVDMNNAAIPEDKLTIVPETADGEEVDINALPYGSDFSFKLKTGDNYDQSSVINAVYDADGNLLTPVNGVYTVEGVRKDQPIKVDASFVLDSYNVTFTPESEIYSVELLSGTNPAPHGSSLSFRLNFDEGYGKTAPALTASFPSLTEDGKPTTTTLPLYAVGGVYTISNITAPTVVTIGAVSQNSYNVSVTPDPTYYSIAPITPSTAVAHGGTYSFKMVVNPPYSKAIVAAYTNGTLLVPTSTNTDAGGTKSYVFTINNITADQTVTFTGFVKNDYTVTLPTDSEGRFTATANSPSTNPVVHGGSYTFTVSLATAYTQSVDNMLVSANGVALKAASTTASTATYVISPVISDVEVTVTGIKVNKYAVRFPADGEGFNVSLDASQVNPVVHGDDFTFAVEIKSGFNGDDMKVTINGNAPATAPTIDADGRIVYTIKNITEMQDIEISNVKRVGFFGRLLLLLSYLASFFGLFGTAA